MSSFFNLFYIYDPWLFHVLRMSLFVGIVSIFWLGYQWYQGEIKQFSLPIDSLMVSFALIIFSIMPVILHRTTELGVIGMYIKSFVIFVLGIVFYNLFYQNAENQKQVIRDLKYGVGFQFLIGVLALSGIPFFISIALGTNTDLFLPRFQGSEQEYRLYNFTSSAFFQLSAFYLMLLHFLLAYNKKENSMSSLYLFLILVIGTISGRTFLVFSIVSIIIYFKWRYVPALIAFVAVILFLAVFFPHNIYVEHALEPLINLINGGERISSSTDTLMQKHLFMPTLKQLLIGDGLYYTNGKSYYGGSDSGFIRQALYGGIGYIFICFAFTFYFIKRIAENWFEGSWVFILSSLFLLSLLNIKADTYAYPGILFILLMFLSLFGTSGRILIFFNKKYKNSEAKNV